MNKQRSQMLGKYKLIKELGQGGFATVYYALDTTLARKVALKVLDPLIYSTPASVQHFHQEAKIAAKLDHLNIVPIYEIDETDGRYYIAMKLVVGQSLEELIQTPSPLPIQRILSILKNVASALDYIHNQGLVHRDVKPSNILIDKDGRAMLSDFGLVRVMETSRLSNLGAYSAGTPFYMAPEQARGNPVDARTDVYALGVVLYEMATGQLPFSADSPFATLYQHVREAPPAPRSINRKLSKPIEQVILRALEKDPDSRYQTAGELAKDFVKAVAGRPLATWHRSSKSKQGRIKTYLQVMVIGIVCIVGILMATYLMGIWGNDELSIWQSSTPMNVAENTPSPVPASCIVPDVVGLDQLAAEELITDLGLFLVNSNKYDDSVASGLVISQDPLPGTQVQFCRGEVTIIISKGSLPIPTNTSTPTDTPTPTNTPIPPTMTPTFTPAPPTLTPTPTPAQPGQTIKGDGIEFTLADYNFFVDMIHPSQDWVVDECGNKGETTVVIYLVARNNSGDDILLQYDETDFRLKDEFGRELPLKRIRCFTGTALGYGEWWVYEPGPREFIWKNGDELPIGPGGELGYGGEIASNANHLILYADKFNPRIPYASWIIEVPR